MKQINEFLDQFIFNEKYLSRKVYEDLYTALLRDGGIDAHFNEMVEEGFLTKEEAAVQRDKVEGSTPEETAFNIIEDEILTLVDDVLISRKDQIPELRLDYEETE